MADKFSTNYFQTVRFPPTIVGKTAKMVFEIKEYFENRDFYDLRKDEAVSPLDRVFTVTFTKCIPRHTKGSVYITYSPVVPFRKVCNFFEIVEKNNQNIALVVYGESTGPHLVASLSELTFFKTPSYQQLVKTFELKNMSPLKVRYHFDTDPNQGEFVVDNPRGVILPHKEKYVTVCYKGTSQGLHTSRLVCLVQNHQPVIIDVRAIHNLDLNPNSLMTKYPIPVSEAWGFPGYMSDVTPVLLYDPPFSFTDTFFDFDYVQGRTESVPRLCFSATNHMKTPIEIKWQPDGNNIFKIMPQHCTVASEQSTLFECSFLPPEYEKMYATQIRGAVYWESLTDNGVNLPIAATIRFMGHSFAPTSSGWLPQAELTPSRVVLPPCVPSVPCYATAMIKRSGHLPVLFKLCPPPNTRYVLKPSQGMIVDEYQIIVVQLSPDDEGEHDYNEIWKVQLNNKKHYQLYLMLNGCSEYPILQVGVNNIVEFQSSYPQCQQGMMVKVWNRTRHSVKYNFLVDEDVQDALSISEPSGVLAAYQCTYLLWTWTARPLNVVDVDVRVSSSAITASGFQFGMPRETIVHASGKTICSFLCSISTSYHFGECQFGIGMSTVFYVFNFGQSEIHFELITTHRGYPIGNPAHDMILYPMFGTVKPMSKEKIMVTIYPNDIGLHQYKIEYDIRKHMYSHERIAHSGIVLFKIDYYAVFPDLEVTDIFYTDCGPLFSKMHMWDLANIDELNQALKNSRPYKYETVNMYFPDRLVNSSVLNMSIYVENKSNYPAHWGIQRRKICDCKPRMKNVGYCNIPTYDTCPHRAVITVNITGDLILPHSSGLINIYVHYINTEPTKLSYILSLSDERTIQLFMNVRSLPTTVNGPSCYNVNYELQFKHVYIGDSRPYTQLFWLYNNSRNVSKYSLDTRILEKMNKSFGTDVITCLNAQGVVTPMEAVPLIFLFRPIEMKRYEAYGILTLGNEKVRLRLSGDGVVRFNDHFPELYGFIPHITNTSNPNTMVKVSCDHFLFKPFPTQSTQERIFFMQNNSDRTLIGYSWKPCSVRNILRVSVFQRKGILKPYERRTLRMRVRSLNTPAYVRNAMLVCEVVDLSQRRKYEKSVADYEAEKRTLDGQFIITETETKIPKPTRSILPRPAPFNLIVSISCVIRADSEVIDEKESVIVQRQHTPATEITLKSDRSMFYSSNLKYRKPVTETCARCIRTIFDLVIGEIVFCNGFKADVERMSIQPSVYYSQTKVHRKVVPRLEQNTVFGPKKHTVSNLIRSFTVSCMNDLFSLEAMKKTKSDASRSRPVDRGDGSCARR